MTAPFYVPDNVHLLGPQRLRPTLRQALDRNNIGSRIATVTAGWEEREGENDELRAHVGREVIDLRIWARLEKVFADDPALHTAMRERYDQVRTLRGLYQRQLAHVLASARELLDAEQTQATVLQAKALEASIEAVRLIDQRHGEHVAAVHASYRERIDAGQYPSLMRERDEVRSVLASCSALCIAGGHVAILLNRLRALGVIDSADQMPIFAWSAGAMVLTENVVLFHDFPPQGAGDSEVLEPGFGLVRGVVLLPHATRRLRLGDPVRVALFARRFAPARAIALDDGAGLELQHERVAVAAGTRLLCADGSVVALLAEEHAA